MDTTDVARTASRPKQDVISPGMADLIQAIIAGIPRELSSEVTSCVSGGKGEFGRQLRMLLENYPRFLKGSVLEKALVPPFEPKTATKLIRAGWSLACCVPGEVLTAAEEAVAHANLCSRDIQDIRVVLHAEYQKNSRWLAWYPPEPIFPGSVGLESQQKVVILGNLTAAASRDFGSVQATIPSFGEACYLLGHSSHLGLQPEEIPLFHTNPFDRYSLAVYVIPPGNEDDELIPRLHKRDYADVLWHPGLGSWPELGILRCLTPDPKK